MARRRTGRSFFMNTSGWPANNTLNKTRKTMGPAIHNPQRQETEGWKKPKIPPVRKNIKEIVKRMGPIIDAMINANTPESIAIRNKYFGGLLPDIFIINIDVFYSWDFCFLLDLTKLELKHIL